MILFIKQGGLLMWPMLIFAIIIVGLTIKKITDFTRSQKLSLEKLEAGINAILFWGFLSLVLGFYAHFHGVYLAMQAISKAMDISPAIVADGYRISLITILFGLLTFMISSIVWFILRWRYKILATAAK